MIVYVRFHDGAGPGQEQFELDYRVEDFEDYVDDNKDLWDYLTALESELGVRLRAEGDAQSFGWEIVSPEPSGPELAEQVLAGLRAFLRSHDFAGA